MNSSNEIRWFHQPMTRRFKRPEIEFRAAFFDLSCHRSAGLLTFVKGLLCVLLFSGCNQSDALNPSPVTASHTPPISIESSPRKYLDDPERTHATRLKSTNQNSWWRDGTAESGIQFTYHNGHEGGQFTILESVGGGAALFDFDQDGDLDLLLPGGGSISSTIPITVSGSPSSLFRNDGQGHFSDQSELIPLPKQSLYTHGAFVSDFNRDGFPDVLITGFGGCILFQNIQGERFEDMTATAGLQTDDWTTAAAWADVNKDGWPDLLLVSYLKWSPRPDASCGDRRKLIRDVCPPDQFPPARQSLYLNNQNGSFSRVENAFEGGGVGKSLGCVALDLNGDSWIDFYVANDQINNQLYLGGPEFPMKEVGVASGTSGNELGIAEGSMGVDAGDYDGDGRPDLWVTNYELEDNSLYRNEGRGLFRHATMQVGLGGVGRPQVGFGTGFADFDLDGWLDLFVMNGHVLYETGRSAYQQTPFLLRNVANGSGRRFVDVTREYGGPWFEGRYAARGAAVGDLDNDGDLDLIVVRQNEPVSVLWNQQQPQDWFKLELRGTSSEPAAVGAIVRYPFEGRELVRHVTSGAGYLSQFDQKIIFPVDQSRTLEVTVQWLTGKSERFRNLRSRSTNLIREGSGEPL